MDADLLYELEQARADLARSERADLDGRVTNEPEWQRTLRRKRDRVADLETLAGSGGAEEPQDSAPRVVTSPTESGAVSDAVTPEARGAENLSGGAEEQTP